jgi:hypothetical protein
MMGNNEIDEFQSFEIDGYLISMKLNNQRNWMFKVDDSYWHQTCTHLYEKAIDLVKQELKQRQNEYTPGDRCPNCDGKGIVVVGVPGWEIECPCCDGVGFLSYRVIPETDAFTDAWNNLTHQQRQAIDLMIRYR